MTAKRGVAWIIMAVAIAGGTTVMGHGIGLQVADTADMRTAGETEFSAGFVFSDTMSGCAARAMGSIEDELRVFFDLGWSDPEGSPEGNIAVQAGGIYALPIDDPSDLALRAAGYYVDTDSIDIIGGSLMLLSSGETLLEGLYVYGGLGLDLSKREVEITRSATSSRGELNPALTVGALYFFTTHISAYVETSYVDEPLIGTGVRYR